MPLDTHTPLNERLEPVCTVPDITSRDEENAKLMMSIPLYSNVQIAVDDAIITRDGTCKGSVAWESCRCMIGDESSSLKFKKIRSSSNSFEC